MPTNFYTTFSVTYSTSNENREVIYGNCVISAIPASYECLLSQNLLRRWLPIMFSMPPYGPHGVDLAQKLANFINLPISGPLLQGGIDIMGYLSIYRNQAVFNFSLTSSVLAI